MKYIKNEREREREREAAGQAMNQEKDIIKNNIKFMRDEKDSKLEMKRVSG
jgi:hypothetical protein